MTAMIIFNIVWAFVNSHWHHILGVLAFFLAMYNKMQHNKLIDLMAEASTINSPKFKKTTKTKKKTRKKK